MGGNAEENKLAIISKPRTHQHENKIVGINNINIRYKPDWMHCYAKDCSISEDSPGSNKKGVSAIHFPLVGYISFLVQKTTYE